MRKHWTRVCLALAMASAFFAPRCHAAGEQAAATPDRPNIIFILADDLGYGDLSCYGSRYVQTPNIDRLARTGTSFTQSYAGSGISSPSRCSLMTGKNTGKTTIRDNQCTANGIRGMKVSPKGDTTYIRRANLLPTDTTIATVLSAAGYRTCLVNKWHLDGYDPMAAPNHRGFHEFYGWTISTVESNSPYYYPYYRFHGDSLIHIDANAHDAHVRHNTDISTDDALAFIDRNRERPFFLYLAHNMPHVPLAVSDKFKGKSEQGLYGDVMMEIDWSVGEVMNCLRELGLEENTLVVLTSDNGPWLNYGNHAGSTFGLRQGKGSTFEGGNRVPCVMYWKGVTKAGSTCNRLASNIDLFPTVAEITNSPLPNRRIDGISLLPLIKGEKNARPRTEFVYYYGKNNLEAVTDGDYKLIFPHRYRDYGAYPCAVASHPGASASFSAPSCILYCNCHNHFSGFCRNAQAAFGGWRKRIRAFVFRIPASHSPISAIGLLS